MSMHKIMAITNTVKAASINQDTGTFKEILEKKRANMVPTGGIAQQSIGGSLKNAVADMVNNHETAIKSINTFMSRTDYSPERLLAVQYKTGILFLREQMFSKTAELSANTLKNFTQMQV